MIRRFSESIPGLIIVKVQKKKKKKKRWYNNISIEKWIRRWSIWKGPVVIWCRDCMGQGEGFFSNSMTDKSLQRAEGRASPVLSHLCYSNSSIQLGATNILILPFLCRLPHFPCSSLFENVWYFGLTYILSELEKKNSEEHLEFLNKILYNSDYNAIRIPFFKP